MLGHIILTKQPPKSEDLHKDKKVAMAAGIVTAMLPMLLKYTFLHKYFIKGVYKESIKE